MFYSDRDRLVYTSPSGTAYDPLALRRGLVTASNGRLNDFLAAWSAEATPEAEQAAAEECLVQIARQAFGLKPFDVEGGVLDAVVLEHLEHMLEWLSVKD